MRHQYYKSIDMHDLDYQSIYDRLEPDDQQQIVEWVNKITARPFRKVGEKGAFELVMKTVIFVARRTR